MTKIDIISGFLGAGKTTLIKKLIAEAFVGEQIVLIENEFGEIGIDGGFLKEAGIEITEMNSGCICCSLVGDFAEALKKVLAEYRPDRILIEPSGVGKLSDVVKAVEPILAQDVVLNSCTTVADVTKCKIYLKNFGEFYKNQIEHAGTILLSRTGNAPQAKVEQAIAQLREIQADATIITTPWEDLTGKQILEAIEHSTAHSTFHAWEEEATCPECGHIHDHDHHHHHDEHCDCHEHEHHHHDEHCDCHEHEHHHHGEHCDCHVGEHHHHGDHRHHHHDHQEHGEHCTCGCHDHHHDHHHHHADEVFTSVGIETARTFTPTQIEAALSALDSGAYGAVLRAKGIVAGADGWIHFDYVPSEHDVRNGAADVIGRLCIIGADLKEDALRNLFLQ